MLLVSPTPSNVSVWTNPSQLPLVPRRPLFVSANLGGSGGGNPGQKEQKSKDIMKTTTNLLDELGGSCIIPNVHNYPRDTDYDGYNDYHSILVD